MSERSESLLRFYLPPELAKFNQIKVYKALKKIAYGLIEAGTIKMEGQYSVTEIGSPELAGKDVKVKIAHEDGLKGEEPEEYFVPQAHIIALIESFGEPKADRSK